MGAPVPRITVLAGPRGPLATRPMAIRKPQRRRKTMTSLFDYVTWRLSNPGLAAIEYALNRVQALSAKHSEQAEIISLGATAWAYGITPEMMDVFGKLASSKRVTRPDLNKLAIHGINPFPLYDDVIKRHTNRKPWLDAKNGEAWVIDVDGYPEPLAVIVDDARFETHMAAINKTDPRITAGHRIWPETGGHDD